ncbi:AI-2E family transporter [Pseudoclavibacter soli]|uniref:AI-2E family transporter n=1 Tax=Pseudoclavibacter soli TaxID=452623 RepID=UPI0004281811|nr:AI-2E family transporter [Pseudoclavibacter soli]
MSQPKSNLSNAEVDARFIPVGVRVAAGWSWRLLISAAALAVLVWALIQVRLVAIPVIVALLFASLLRPLVERMRRAGLHKWVAVISVELLFVALVGGLVAIIVAQFSDGVDDFVQRTKDAYLQLAQYLLDSPLHITQDNITDYVKSLLESVQQDRNVLVNGALSVGTTAGHLATGVLLVIFSLLFFLADGPLIFSWVTTLLPAYLRPTIAGAGRAGWRTLSSYVRVQILVAAIDAIGIGIGALALGLPMVLPLSLLVFVGSFVPILGAVVSGALVCLVALIYKGWVVALIMLAVVIAVQQIESHVLQPLVMGNAVKVHPLGVVLSVAIGTMLGGIPGAMFAVPLVAVINRVVGYFYGREWEHDDFAKAVAETMGTNDERDPHALAEEIDERDLAQQTELDDPDDQERTK